MIQSILQELNRLMKPSDMPRRIELCKEALRLVDRLNDPELWAIFQFQLGSSFQLNPFDDRAENIEKAIEALKNAQRVFKREKHPREWAAVQNNLGNVYWDRVRGNRRENIEKAIEALNQALMFRTQDDSPVDWAMTQNNLGNAYRDRIADVRAENLERALVAFQKALTVFTFETYPDRWAMTKNNMGLAYLHRIFEDRAENLEQAIDAFQSALKVFTREDFAEHWAMAQHNLGVAYFFRIKDDRSENLEKAIESFCDALSIYSLEVYPVDWAMTQHSLGNVYRERILGDLEKNIEKAIIAYKNALMIYNSNNFRIDWARTLLNLGTAYRKRIAEQHADNIEKAIQAYEAALSVFTHDNFPEEWAGAQLNLGNAYLKQADRNREDSIEKAIGAFQAALKVFTRDNFPIDWAKTQHNLGNALSKGIEDESDHNLALAEQTYNAALEIFVPKIFPKAAFDSALSLGQIQFKRHNWEGAYATLKIATTASEILYDSTLSSQTKRIERTETALLFQLLVDVCLRLTPQRCFEAFMYAEEGHTHLLRSQLRIRSVFSLQNAPIEIKEREKQLLEDIRNLEAWVLDATDQYTRRRWLNYLATTRDELNKLNDTSIQEYGASKSILRLNEEKLNWNNLRHWLSSQKRKITLLEFFTLADRLIAFIINHDTGEPVAISLEISLHQLGDYVRRFFREVRFRFNIRHRLEETWLELGSRMLPEVMPYLKDTDLLYIIPHTVLHELPLHALEYNGKPLIEYFPIVYAPSIAALLSLEHHNIHDASNAGKQINGKNSLVVANTKGDLPLAGEVAVEISDRIGAHLLLHNEASKLSVQSALAKVLNAHFITHAHYNSKDPLASGIHLAYHEVLTARDILPKALNIELLALWACESGEQDIDPGDERTGLAPAFLGAGVSSLVLSMWEVNTAETISLIYHFYDSLYDNDGIKRTTTADALRAAMLRTREMSTLTHHWAPFMLYGIWN